MPFILADRFTALLTLAFSGGHRTILSYGSTLSVEWDIAQVKETRRSSNDNSTRVLNSMCRPGTTADCDGQSVLNFKDLTNGKLMRMDT